MPRGGASGQHIRAAADSPVFARVHCQGAQDKPGSVGVFQQLAPTHRRNFVVWIHLAKRAETREKRIRESIALLAAGKKLGLK